MRSLFVLRALFFSSWPLNLAKLLTKQVPEWISVVVIWVWTQLTVMCEYMRARQGLGISLCVRIEGRKGWGWQDWNTSHWSQALQECAIGGMGHEGLELEKGKGERGMIRFSRNPVDHAHIFFLWSLIFFNGSKQCQVHHHRHHRHRPLLPRWYIMFVTAKERKEKKQVSSNSEVEKLKKWIFFWRRVLGENYQARVKIG